MKITLHRTNGCPLGFTTVGYWKFTEPENQGELQIFLARLPDRRFQWAVLGHELIESFYCWSLGITTEQCDEFDAFYEAEYSAGRIPKTAEPGCDRRCPYHWGHMLGIAWEYCCIYGTFASWKKYEAACNQVMGI